MGASASKVSDAELKELEAALAELGKEPWRLQVKAIGHHWSIGYADSHRDARTTYYCDILRGRDEVQFNSPRGCCGKEPPATARFAVLAKNLLPAILAELRSKRKVRKP